MPLIKKKDKGRLVAVFDIGTASVGGLLFRYKEGHLPEILSSLRRSVSFQNQHTQKHVIYLALSSIAKNLKKNISENLALTICVFSSPWHVSQTKIIKVQRDKSFEISKDLIDKLIEEEKEFFKKHWQNSFWKKRGTTVFLEYFPTAIFLNDYNIKTPFGKKARKLNLYIYLSLGLKSFCNKIEEVISNYIKSRSFHFFTFPFVLFKTLNQIINTKEGLILVDITGELTDIFLIKNNVIEEINYFTKGENFLIRRLASILNLNLNEAKSLFLEYQREELDPTYSQKISEILSPAAEEWGDLLKKLLKEMAHNKFLPQNLYFCGPAASLKEINNQVSREEFSQFTILGKPFNVKFLTPDSLKYHFDFAKGFSENKDIFLLISSLFATKFLKI